MLSARQAVDHVVRKQHLVRPRAGGCVAVADVVVGLHATLPATPYLSLHARLRGFRREHLDHELFDSRSLMRLKAMRGTVFIFSRALAPIAHAATRGMTLQRDLKFLGIDPAAYRRVAPRIAAALGGLSLSAREIRTAVRGGDDVTKIVGLLSDEGVLVRDRPSGSWRSSAFRYRLWSDAFPDVNLAAHDPADATRALVERYFAAYGPATLADAAWWTGLGMRAVTRAVQSLGDLLVEVPVAGTASPFLMTRDDVKAVRRAGTRRASQSVFALPALDPFLMAYKDRDRYLDPRLREYVFDRGGNATSTIIIDGIVSGVWDVTETPEPAAQFLLFKPSRSAREAASACVSRAAAFWFGARVDTREYASMVPLTARGGVMRKPLDGATPA